MRVFALLILVALTMSPSISYAQAQHQSFQNWLQGFALEARASGISKNLIHGALMQNIQYRPRVIELDRKQPEKKITFAKYKRNVVNQTRIDKGRKLMRRHARQLHAVSQQYGVQPQYIVALWGIETNFGGYTGGFRVLDSLATLAYEGRRRDFFKDELLNALKILQEGHIEPARMKGSWAGAMGQNQFMPSSFMRFAVDHNRDGRKDIWDSHPDIFASTANYLLQNGWKAGERWGRRVLLPKGFDYSVVKRKTKKTVNQWNRLGVRKANGTSLPNVSDMPGRIVTPDGPGGEAYLVYNNYDTIMRWNRSTYFATSVGLLADLIAIP